LTPPEMHSFFKSKKEETKGCVTPQGDITGGYFGPGRPSMWCCPYCGRPIPPMMHEHCTNGQHSTRKSRLQGRGTCHLPDCHRRLDGMVARAVLNGKKKSCPVPVFPKKPAGTPCAQPWLVAVGGWRLAAVDGWQLATGGWWR
jgi:hypothetical protein